MATFVKLTGRGYEYLLINLDLISVVTSVENSDEIGGAKANAKLLHPDGGHTYVQEAPDQVRELWISAERLKRQ